MSGPVLEGVAAEVGAMLGLKVLGFCGSGAFKETFKVESKDGSISAMKLVDREKINVARTDREIDALRKCNSPRIAKLLDRSSHTSKAGKQFDVVLEEFLDGGSLEERVNLKSPTPAEVMLLIKGLTLALKDLRQLQLVHRDIKPANVMFRRDQPDHPVLVDFGLVRDLSQSSLTHTWLPHGPGTPFFAPAEQLNNEKALIDWRADQFSVGIVASVLLFGHHPYRESGMTDSDAIYAVSTRRPVASSFVASAERIGAGFLIKMVRPWPVQRFASPDQILDQLKA